MRVMERPAAHDSAWDASQPDPSKSSAPYAVYNIGNHEPVELVRFIETLEELLGKKAQKEMLPMQAGDVYETYADIDRLTEATGFRPTTALKDGLRKFVDWYRDYYRA
jgi:UDP-glucuronate 4-epimerase